VLRFAREFAHPPERVWQALIEPSELKGWFPCRIEGERALGATIRFVFDNNNAPVTEGKITEFDPPHRLAYTWDQEVLRWELRPTPRGSLLIFTNSIDYTPTGLAAGWHTGLDVLERQLDGRPATWSIEERLDELQKEYETHFEHPEEPANR
jgi:uncharacterized protein YndB with AHSA1/START domain